MKVAAALAAIVGVFAILEAGKPSDRRSIGAYHRGIFLTAAIWLAVELTGAFHA